MDEGTGAGGCENSWRFRRDPEWLGRRRFVATGVSLRHQLVSVRHRVNPASNALYNASARTLILAIR